MNIIIMLFRIELFVILCALNNATNNIFSRLPPDPTKTILESLPLAGLINLRKTKNRNLVELIDNSDNKLTQWASVRNFVSFINESMYLLNPTNILFDLLLQKIKPSKITKQETKMMEEIISKLVINHKLSLNSKIKIANKLFNISGIKDPETEYEYKCAITLNQLQPLCIMQQMMHIIINPPNEQFVSLIPLKLETMLDFGYDEMKKTNKKYNIYTNVAFCFLDWFGHSAMNHLEIIDIWSAVHHVVFIRDFLNRNVPFLEGSKVHIIGVIIDDIMMNGVCDYLYKLLMDISSPLDKNLIIDEITTSQLFNHSNSCNLLKTMIHSKWMNCEEIGYLLTDNIMDIVSFYEEETPTKDNKMDFVSFYEGETPTNKREYSQMINERIRKMKEYLLTLQIQSQNEMNESAQIDSMQKAMDSAQTVEDLDELRKILKSEKNQTIAESERSNDCCCVTM